MYHIAAGREVDTVIARALVARRRFHRVNRESRSLMALEMPVCNSRRETDLLSLPQVAEESTATTISPILRKFALMNVEPMDLLILSHSFEIMS